MKVTPLDLRQQKFKTVMRGYDRGEVTAFLTEVADDYENALSLAAMEPADRCRWMDISDLLDDDFVKRGWPLLHAGVGLNCGEMSVGDMGSKFRRAYTVLGVEHILTGFDHLLFVLALLFLVGFNRQLLFTITAFTLAHSLTLALSALGLLTLRSPPVEATIALSIVLVAAEALHGQRTLSRSWPALVAFLFGLVPAVSGRSSGMC